MPFDLRPPERARRVDSRTGPAMAPSTGRTDNQLNAKPPIGGQPVSKIIPPARAAAWGPGVDVALQARAEVTRQKIIDSAVALFRTAGFGDTGLADIISHADVTNQPDPPSPSNRTHCRPATGPASAKCHPRTGAAVSTMNRNHTSCSPVRVTLA